MTQFRIWVPSRHTRRVCLGCGYRGAELQRDGYDAALVCPGCGQDLYARPPRSYAELEGFIESSRRVSRRAEAASGRGRRSRRSRGVWWWLGRVVATLLKRPIGWRSESVSPPSRSRPYVR